MEVSMRLLSAGTLRTVSFAAIPLVAVLSSACGDQPNATAPIGGRPVEVSAQPLSSISTDPIMDIVTAVTAAWAAKDAAAYAAPYAADVQMVSPRGDLVAGRDALRAQHLFLFGGPFAGSTQTITVRDIQFLTGTTHRLRVSSTGAAVQRRSRANPRHVGGGKARRELGDRVPADDAAPLAPVVAIMRRAS
jgi:uncharacterized protein (TIGR02246 family)